MPGKAKGKSTSTPSSFYKNIGNKKGYMQRVRERNYPDIISMKKTEKLSGEITIVNNSQLHIEGLIGNYMKTRDEKVKTDLTTNYIKGCNIDGFINHCINNYTCKSGECNTHVRMTVKKELEDVFADIIYGNCIVDIKSYKTFTATKIIEAFVQLLLYSQIYKENNITTDNPKIDFVAIFVPTHNEIHYIKIDDSNIGGITRMYNDFMNKAHVVVYSELPPTEMIMPIKVEDKKTQCCIIL